MMLGHRRAETQAGVQVRNMLEQGGEEEVEAGGAAMSPITVATLDAELEPLILSKAAQHGLAPAWITCLARLDPHRRQVPQPLAPCLSSQQLHTASLAPKCLSHPFSMLSSPAAALSCGIGYRFGYACLPGQHCLCIPMLVPLLMT